MRASRADKQPRSFAHHRLYALAAFAAGMLVAFTAALVYVHHVQSRGTLQAANVNRPERSKVSAADAEPATLPKHLTSTSAPVPVREQTPAPGLAAEPSTLVPSAAKAPAVNNMPVRSVP